MRSVDSHFLGGTRNEKETHDDLLFGDCTRDIMYSRCFGRRNPNYLRKFAPSVNSGEWNINQPNWDTLQRDCWSHLRVVSRARRRKSSLAGNSKCTARSRRPL